MPTKRLVISLVSATLLAVSQPLYAAELSTLFTTPQERQIINTNRYKSDEVRVQQPVVVEDAGEMPLQQLLKEEVSREYKISGITVSRDGPHTVWINSLAREDGEELEDGSKIRVMLGNEVRVRITAPDGKHYYATSGETLAVTYLAPVEN